MSDLFALLLYIGGASAWANQNGFWKGLLWPYYLGKHLAQPVKGGGK